VSSNGLGPLVSVVVPTHDRPDRLEQALHSVFAQTYRHLDVIVVDDASAQSVEERIPAPTCDRRVRVERLEVSAGAAGARNRGLEMAEGELVAFLDDDDRWAPTKIERQVRCLQDRPRIGIVTCDHVMARDDSSSPVRFRGPSRITAESLRWANFAGSFSFVMARRSVLGDALRIDERFPTVEDWDLWLRCAERAPVEVLPEPLTTYVFHEDSRLTDSLCRGLELFADKHHESMSNACIGFHSAHLRMAAGNGWAKRLEVARALMGAPAETMPLLLLEQAARRLGRLRRDPGVSARMLARRIERLPRR
jgi:glycosyltransferase involved in cell wall biosynthesis